MKCEFAGCKHEARWAARKLWGKGGTLRTCDQHRPDPAKLPEKLAHLRNRVWYDVRPIKDTGAIADRGTI